MTKEQWRKRQEQWDRFHAWEAQEPPLKLSPSERLAELGALVDRLLASLPRQSESAEELRKNVAGIVLMRKSLTVLRGAT